MSFSGPRKGVSSIVEKGFAIVVIVIVAAIIKTNTNAMSAAKIQDKYKYNVSCQNREQTILANVKVFLGGFNLKYHSL